MKSVVKHDACEVKHQQLSGILSLPFSTGGAVQGSGIANSICPPSVSSSCFANGMPAFAANLTADFVVVRQLAAPFTYNHFPEGLSQQTILCAHQGAPSQVQIQEITLSLAIAGESSEPKVASGGGGKIREDGERCEDALSEDFMRANIGMSLHRRFKTKFGESTPLVDVLNKSILS